MDIQPIYLLFCFLAFVGAGIVQTTTGFGSGIFVMIFLPMFLPVTGASALSSVVSFFLTIAMAWRYRAHARIKEIIPLAIVNVVCSSTCIYLSANVIDLSGLKAYLGLFLIVVAIWMAFFAHKLRIKPSMGSALICGSISGAANGFFSTGGPPIVVYLLGAYGDDKLAYLGTFQWFGIMTGIVTIGMRIYAGTMTASLVPYVLPGLIGIYLGMFVGNRIVDRINVEQMKKLIYAFLAVSGLITFISNL